MHGDRTNKYINTSVNRFNRSSSDISRIDGAKTAPESYTTNNDGRCKDVKTQKCMYKLGQDGTKLLTY